jgi:hypothetical protein
MATVVYKSSKVTNLDANPPVHNPVGQSGGRVRCWQGTHELSAATLITDLLLLDRVPWNLRPISIELAWDDLGGTMTMELGLWYPDNTEVDRDEFGSALAGGTAAAMTDYTYEAASTDFDRVGKTLWEWAGLSAMPDVHGGMVDIGLYFTAATTPNAGTISWRILGTLD